MAKRVRPSSIYQRADSPLRALAMAGERRVKRAIKAALRHAGEIVRPEIMAAKIRNGLLLSAAADGVDWGHLREVFKAVFAEIGDIRFAAAEIGARHHVESFPMRPIDTLILSL